MKTKPMTMLLAMLAGWINQQQQEIIEYPNLIEAVKGKYGIEFIEPDELKDSVIRAHYE